MRELAAAAVVAATATTLPGAPAEAAVAPFAARLADTLRYTADGDVAVFVFVDSDPDADEGDRVRLWSTRGVVATGTLGDRNDDGTRVAELRVRDLPPGVQRLKACSLQSCATAVHVVYDGAIDGITAALLGRRATAAELDRYAGRPLDEIARDVAASDERALGVVRELYRFHLGRNPEADGIAFWLGQLAAGVTADEMAVALCGAEPRPQGERPPGRCLPSIDFLGTVGPVDDDPAAVAASAAAREWAVRRTFLTLLGREPELGARRHWTDTLTGAAAPDPLLVGVLGTAEYVDHVTR